MKTLSKVTEEWIIDTEEEAEQLIEDAKKNQNDYNLKQYKLVKKEKKKDGEIIDSYVITTLVKEY